MRTTNDLFIVMIIKVLGTGCPNCKTLEKATIEMVKELGIKATVTKEQDIIKIMEYGVMRTPGLVIDDQVVFSGRVPSSKELKEILTR